jgi:drug/metabolite transporter (DMT)-like permease
MNVPHRRPYLEYAALSLIWGLSFLFMLRTSRAFGLVGSVCFRALLAAAVLRGFAFLRDQRLNIRSRAGAFAVVGATTVAGQLLGLSYGMRIIGTAMTAILVAAIPLFTMLIGHFSGLERMRRRTFGGVLLGMLGIALLVGFPAVELTPRFLLGCGAALLGALSSAIGSNYASARLAVVDPLEITAGAFFFGGLWVLPLLWFDPVPAPPALGDYASLLVLGIFMSALAYVLYFRLVATIGATRAVSVEFLVTVVAVVIGTFLLHETLTRMQILGALAIIAGCALVLDLLPLGPPLRAGKLSR